MEKKNSKGTNMRIAILTHTYKFQRMQTLIHIYSGTNNSSVCVCVCSCAVSHVRRPRPPTHVFQDGRRRREARGRGAGARAGGRLRGEGEGTAPRAPHPLFVRALQRFFGPKSKYSGEERKSIDHRPSRSGRTPRAGRPPFLVLTLGPCAFAGVSRRAEEFSVFLYGVTRIRMAGRYRVKAILYCGFLFWGFRTIRLCGGSCLLSYQLIMLRDVLVCTCLI